MTTRLEGDPLDAHWRGLAGGATVMTVDLSPLSPADALSMARRFIEADESRAPVRGAGRRQPAVPRAIAEERCRPHRRAAAEFDPERRARPHRSLVARRIGAPSRPPRSSANASRWPISGRCCRSRATAANCSCQAFSCGRSRKAFSSRTPWCATASTARSRMRENGNCTKPPPGSSATDIRSRARRTLTAPGTPRRRGPISRRPKCKARSSGPVPGYRAGDARTGARGRELRRHRPCPASRGFAAGRRTRPRIAQGLRQRAGGERRSGGQAARAGRPGRRQSPHRAP